MEELAGLQRATAAGAAVNGGGTQEVSAGDHCYAAIVEHWAKARIEGPLQAVSHYDDSAKLLVTLGGLFPAILVAAFSAFTQPTQTPLGVALRRPSTALFGAFLVFFLAFVGCLVMACARQMKVSIKMKSRAETDACEVYLLLKQAAEGNLRPGDITEAVKLWSERLDQLIRYKQRWVQLACVCLTISSTCMMVLLFATATGVQLKW